MIDKITLQMHEINIDEHCIFQFNSQDFQGNVNRNRERNAIMFIVMSMDVLSA